MSENKLAFSVVVSDLRHLADSLASLAGVLETKAADAGPADQAAEQEPTKTPEQPTLEAVRAAMAGKNRAGHREAMKSILLKYGANKLTALDSQHYTTVLQEVEAVK